MIAIPIAGSICPITVRICIGVPFKASSTCVATSVPKYRDSEDRYRRDTEGCNLCKYKLYKVNLFHIPLCGGIVHHVYEYGVDGASQIPYDGPDKTKGYGNRNCDLRSGSGCYSQRCSDNPCNAGIAWNCTSDIQKPKNYGIDRRTDDQTILRIPRIRPTMVPDTSGWRMDT